MQCSSGNAQQQQESANMDAKDMYMAARVGFFTADDLHAGNKMTVQFFTKDPSSLPPFLSREEADRVPFSLSEFPRLLELFSFSRGSREAKLIERTLENCAQKPMMGERKTCATSRESLVDFVSSVLGGRNGVDFRALKTAHLGKPSSLFQNYTFLDVKEVNTPNMVACHIMDYPYAVYLCHSQTSKVYQILLAGHEDGDVINAVAVCHVDTSHWGPDHISFRFLGVKPGTVPVCHFFGPHNLIWVQN